MSKTPATPAPFENPFRFSAADIAGMDSTKLDSFVQDTYGDLDEQGIGKMTDAARRANIGKPVTVVEFHYMPSDRFGNGGFIRALIAVHERDGKTTPYLLDASGKGIAAELEAFQARTGRNGGVRSNAGLRVSDYQFCTYHKLIVGSKDDFLDGDHSGRTCEVKDTATWYLDIA